MNAPFPGTGEPDTYQDFVDHAEPPVEVKYVQLLARIDEVINDPNESEYLRLRFKNVRDHRTNNGETKR